MNALASKPRLSPDVQNPKRLVTSTSGYSLHSSCRGVCTCSTWRLAPADALCRRVVNQLRAVFTQSGTLLGGGVGAAGGAAGGLGRLAGRLPLFGVAALELAGGLTGAAGVARPGSALAAFGSGTAGAGASGSDTTGSVTTGFDTHGVRHHRALVHRRLCHWRLRCRSLQDRRLQRRGSGGHRCGCAVCAHDERNRHRTAEQHEADEPRRREPREPSWAPLLPLDLGGLGLRRSSGQPGRQLGLRRFRPTGPAGSGEAGDPDRGRNRHVRPDADGGRTREC